MTEANELQFHDAANLFPLLQGQEFKELVADIKANGLREPIVLHPDGTILDGRNRYRACLEAGVEPTTLDWIQIGDETETDLVLSLNLYRRHLTSSQRACIAAEVLPVIEEQTRQREAARKKGDEPTPQDSAESSNGESREKAAKLLGTNRDYVSKAKKILQHNPKAFEKVKRGEQKLPDAYWDVQHTINEKKRKADDAKWKRDREKRLAKLPTPEEANAQARETGQAVEANDGIFYTGVTEEEKAAAAERRQAAWRMRQDLELMLSGIDKLGKPETDDYRSGIRNDTAEIAAIVAEMIPQAQADRTHYIYNFDELVENFQERLVVAIDRLTTFQEAFKPIAPPPETEAPTDEEEPAE